MIGIGIGLGLTRSGSGGGVGAWPRARVVVSGFPPATGADLDSTWPSGAVDVGAFAPASNLHIVSRWPTTGVNVTGFDPTGATGRTWPSGSVVVTGFAPAVGRDYNVDWPAGSVSVTSNAVQTSEAVNSNWPVSGVDVQGQAPATGRNYVIAWPSGSASVTGVAPATAESGGGAWVPSDDFGAGDGQISVHNNADSWRTSGSQSTDTQTVDAIDNNVPGSPWQPTSSGACVAEDVNGVLTLRFPGGAGNFFANPTEVLLNNTQLWAVLAVDDAGVAGCIIADDDANPRLELRGQTGSVWLTQAYSTQIITGNVVSSETYHLFRLDLADDGAEFFVDGVSRDSTSTTYTTDIPIDLMGCGRSSDNLNVLVGNIAELILVNGASDATLQANLETYLGDIRDTLNGV